MTGHRDRVTQGNPRDARGVIVFGLPWTPQQPAFLIREARVTDHRRLLRLARELDSVNLPTDSAEMAATLARSAKSFRGRVSNRARAVYIFCAEEIATRKIPAPRGLPAPR